MTTMKIVIMKEDVHILQHFQLLMMKIGKVSPQKSRGVCRVFEKGEASEPNQAQKRTRSAAETL